MEHFFKFNKKIISLDLLNHLRESLMETGDFDIISHEFINAYIEKVLNKKFYQTEKGIFKKMFKKDYEKYKITK